MCDSQGGMNGEGQSASGMVAPRPWCWSQFLDAVYPKIAIFVGMRVFDGDDGVLR